MTRFILSNFIFFSFNIKILNYSNIIYGYEHIYIYYFIRKKEYKGERMTRIMKKEKIRKKFKKERVRF